MTIPPVMVMLLAAPLSPPPIPDPCSPPVAVTVPPEMVMLLAAPPSPPPIPAPYSPPFAVRLPSPEMVSVPIFSASPFF